MLCKGCPREGCGYGPYLDCILCSEDGMVKFGLLFCDLSNRKLGLGLVKPLPHVLHPAGSFRAMESAVPITCSWVVFTNVGTRDGDGNTEVARHGMKLYCDSTVDEEMACDYINRWKFVEPYGSVPNVLSPTQHSCHIELHQLKFHGPEIQLFK